MNDQKLKQLFDAVRRELPPENIGDVTARVMREVRRELPPVSIFDELSLLFPRVTWAAVAVIALCVAGEIMLTLPGLSEGAAQLSDQWLFAAN